MSPGLRPARAGHAFKQAHRAQVDVLVELAAELEQRTHSETWSGTVAGQPTAPKKMASMPDSCAFQSSGIICRARRNSRSWPIQRCAAAKSRPKRLAAAMVARRPSGMTLPMPSPASTAILVGLGHGSLRVMGWQWWHFRAILSKYNPALVVAIVYTSCSKTRRRTTCASHSPSWCAGPALPRPRKNWALRPPCQQAHPPAGRRPGREAAAPHHPPRERRRKRASAFPLGAAHSGRHGPLLQEGGRDRAEPRGTGCG